MFITVDSTGRRSSLQPRATPVRLQFIPDRTSARGEFRHSFSKICSAGTERLPEMRKDVRMVYKLKCSLLNFLRPSARRRQILRTENALRQNVWRLKTRLTSRELPVQPKLRPTLTTVNSLPLPFNLLGLITALHKNGKINVILLTWLVS